MRRSITNPGPRIQPEQVSFAFQRKGIKPLRSKFISIDIEGNLDCACGLVVFYLQKQDYLTCSFSFLETLALNWSLMTYGLEYTNGFINGWDNHEPSNLEGKPLSERYVQGFCDGVDSFEQLENV